MGLLIFIIFTIVGLIGMVGIYRESRSRKPKPDTWNDALTRIIDAQYPAKGSIQELENWWQANESKDARIKELESQLATSKAIGNSYKDAPYLLNNYQASKAWEQVATPTLVNPSKVMMLPKGVEYYDISKPTIAGFNIKGPLADMIMAGDPKQEVRLTIRGGKVTDWTVNWEGNEWS
jgi:hypothetical protein